MKVDGCWFEFSGGGASPTVIIFHPTVQCHSLFKMGDSVDSSHPLASYFVFWHPADSAPTMRGPFQIIFKFLIFNSILKFVLHTTIKK